MGKQLKRLIFALTFGLAALAGIAQAAPPAPRLDRSGPVPTLIVDGKPFLIIGGELGNSTASDLDYLRPYWAKFDALHMNTVLAPVYWELIEPEEGKFDFTSVDGLLKDARAADKRLVLLWFASWKNSQSSYAPSWVKRDSTRFPRAQTDDGTFLELLTPLSEDNRDADARAFGALMAHLGRIDQNDRTVIMIQVENEIGMIPTARDFSPLAEAAWRTPVPESVREAVGKNVGDWAALSPELASAEEMFMAWHFARYVEAIARAGKEAYDIPMYTNAALARPGRVPGPGYPSAGPLPRTAKIWHAGAPSLDFLSPDIYFNNFVEWSNKYMETEPVLFVPETRSGDTAGANLFWMVGHHGGIGFSPFSIESIEEPDDLLLTSAYDVLSQLTPLVFERHGTNRIVGFVPPVTFEGEIDDSTQTFVIGDYKFIVNFVYPYTPKEDQNIAGHGGMILQLAPEEFIIVGHGVEVSFEPADGKGWAGIDKSWEGTFEDGKWKPGRLLNGDQTHQGRLVRLPLGKFSIQRTTLYRYP